MFTRITASIVLVALLVASSRTRAEEQLYAPRQISRAELRITNDVPLLTLSGTPEEMGAQEAELVGDRAKELLVYAPKMIRRAGGEVGWWLHAKVTAKLMENAPERFRAELKSLHDATGVPVDELHASQTIFDSLNTFGCSSLIVPPEQSATAGPLFGRNLDYVTFGLLQRYNLVKVYRPTGKFAFVSMGFPGCVGVVSGMNEHGLCLALHEIRATADGSPKFDAAGVPTLLLLRELLEECRTVEEARTHLAARKRATLFTLPICDPQGGSVFEVTVKQVSARRGDGLTVGTNHFRQPELSVTKTCARYEAITRSPLATYQVTDVIARLQAANQGKATFQSMVFEPKALTIHLSLQAVPSSGGEFKRVEFGELLKTN